MGITTERYPAVVSNVEDPENRGRIKVLCVGILGDEEAEVPDWVEPAYQWGWFVVPKVGQLVEIEVAISSDEDEHRGQYGIDNPDLKWDGATYYTEAGDDNTEATSIHPDFLESYGQRRGFATPAGHVLLFDDTEGAPKVYLTWAQEAGNVADISQLVFDVDGTIKLTALNKHVLHLKENEIEVQLDEGAALKITGKDADATTILGDGGVKAAIADHLETLYGVLKTKLDAFDTHVHPTGMGPSGTPTPIVQAPAWDSAINSTKLTFPDG